METFTLSTAIGINMKAFFYADSVNATVWNKAGLFFWIGCVFAGNVFMQIHEINPTGKFPKRPRNLWEARTVHKQSKYCQYWNVFFDWDRKGAIYVLPTVSLYPNAIGKTLSLTCQTYLYDCMRTNIGRAVPRRTLGIVIAIICNIDKWININYFNVCCQIMKIDTLT